MSQSYPTLGKLSQPVEKKGVTVARLTPSVYEALAKSLPPPAKPSTDLEAGYLLGIQKVLQSLREGFMVDA